MTDTDRDTIIRAADLAKSETCRAAARFAEFNYAAGAIHTAYATMAAMCMRPGGADDLDKIEQSIAALESGDVELAGRLAREVLDRPVAPRELGGTQGP